LEALWIYGSNANPAVLEKIIFKRDENWDSKEINFEHYEENHPLRYIFHKLRVPKAIDSINFEQAQKAGHLMIGSLKFNQQRLEILLQRNFENSDFHFLLNFVDYPRQNGNAENTFSCEIRHNILDSLNFPDFPNNEHTQFVGSTAPENQDVENLWNKIFVTPLEEHVLKGLHLFDNKIQKMGLIVKPNKNIPMIFVENERIPLKHLGEGMYRVFHIILALVNAKNGFLLIDEFENGLHYTVQPRVWELISKLAEELNVQVFVTTHSWDCVRAFVETIQETETEAMLFHLGRSALKSDANKIITTAYDKEELKLVSQAELEVR
jgi:AAA15 family ATPase/GTPase